MGNAIEVGTFNIEIKVFRLLERQGSLCLLIGVYKLWPTNTQKRSLPQNLQ